MKKAMASAGVLIAIGLVLFMVAFVASGCDFIALVSGEYETVTHEPVGEFDRISIVVDTADVTFLPSEDGACRVVACESTNKRHTVSIADGVLSVTVGDHPDRKKWYDYISIGGVGTTITVYLPEKEYVSLAFDGSTGDISIPSDFTFGEATIDNSTGDIDLAASVSGALSITMSTGNASIHDASLGELSLSLTTGDVRLESLVCGGAVAIKQSTGRLTISDVTAASFSSEANTGDGVMTGLTVSGDLRLERSTGDLVLTDCKALSLTSESSSGDVTARGLLVGAAISITTDTGEVELDASDAAEIYITTDTGDVEASFLSPKIFFYDTDTGDVEIKKSTTGGKCEVVTDSGDISLDFVG